MMFRSGLRRVLGAYAAILTGIALAGPVRGVEQGVPGNGVPEGWRAQQPLVPAGTMGPEGVASRVDRLTIDERSLQELSNLNEAPGVLLPIGDGKAVVAMLERVNVLAPGAQVVSVGETGERPLADLRMQLWRGSVLGEPGSEVFVGLAPGQAYGWIKARGGKFFITTAQRAEGWAIMAYDTALLPKGGNGAAGQQQSCAGGVDVPGSVRPPATGLFVPRGAFPTSCRVFDVAVETDNEFRAGFASTAAAAGYAMFLIGADSEIYNSELNVGLRVSFLRVWDVADPWTSTDTSAQLVQFRDYWRANQGGTSRSTVHMLSRRSLGGGIAYLSRLCDNDWSYGVSANLDLTFPYPLANNSSFNWDVYVTAHELGHNFGTNHTHNICEYNPIIDGCGLDPTRSACEQGTQDCTVATAQNGTIMSYCHTCSGGTANIDLVFGPRVITRIQSYLATIPACGTTGAGVSVTSVTAAPSTSVNCGDNVTLTATATGADLTYQWFRNGVPMAGETGSVLTITGALAENAGTYTVLVRNGCATVNTAGGPLSLTLTVTGACSSAPPNDGCASALPVGAFVSGVSTTAGTAANATTDGSCTCQSGSSTGPDVYYTLVVSSATQYTLETCGGTPLWDTTVSVHTGCPATTANQVAGACGDDGCASGVGTLSYLPSMVLQSGTYIIRVAGWSSSDVGKAFTLKITDLGPAATLPDECASRTVIPGNGLRGHSTSGATTSVQAAPSCGAVNRDVWYEWTAPASGVLRYATMMSGGRYSVYGGGTSVDCAALGTALACSTTGNWAEVSVTGGRIYVIRSGFSSAATAGNALDNLDLWFVASAVGSCCTGAACAVVAQAECTGTWVGSSSCVPDTATVSTYGPGPGGSIPDFLTATGTSPLVSTISVADSFTVANVELDLTFAHTWAGDLVITLSKGGRSIELVHRAVRTSSSINGASSDFVAGNTYTFTDSGAQTLHTALAALPATVPSGQYKPATIGGMTLNLRNTFNGIAAAGDWKLSIVDWVNTDVGALTSWTLRLRQGGTSVCATGECCTASGQCQVQTQGACTGNWTGGGSCSPNPCPQPTGECCVPSGQCIVGIQSACGGNWTIGGTCSPNQCPQPSGECCVPGGQCQVLTQNACTGNWTIGGSCSPNPCPQPPGECCVASGQCQVLTQNACTGNWTIGGTCSPNLCPQPTGACCIPVVGNCMSLTLAQCVQLSGAYQGDGHVCSPNPCPAPGTCCRGSTCNTTVAAAGCTSPGPGIGAAYAVGGLGNSCNTTGNSAAPCCHADFNKTAGVTVQDIFDYLAAWFAGSPYARFAGDGGGGSPTAQSIFDFLAAWFGGPCPAYP